MANDMNILRVSIILSNYTYVTLWYSDLCIYRRSSILAKLHGTSLHSNGEREIERGKDTGGGSETPETYDLSLIAVAIRSRSRITANAV